MALKVGELFASLSVDAKAFESGLSGAASTFAKTSAEIGEMAKKTQKNVDDLGSSIGATATKVGKTVKDVGAQSITTTNEINDKIKNVAQTLGRVVTVKKVLDLAWSGIQYNAQIEQLQTSFEVMSGSAEVAADTVQRLKNVGAATPYDLSGLAQTTQLLMNYGFSAEDAVDQLLMLGDIAQGDANKLISIARGYAQMSSAARVNLQDINQMINSGFNPLQEISESTGESMESLYDRISKGSMDVLEITASIIRSTSEGGKFFKSMEKQSKTFNGQLSTLKDNWKSVIGVLTRPINDVLTDIVFPGINDGLEIAEILGNLITKTLTNLLSVENIEAVWDFAKQIGSALWEGIKEGSSGILSDLFDKSETYEAEKRLNEMLSPENLRSEQVRGGKEFDVQVYFDELREIGASEDQISGLVGQYAEAYGTEVSKAASQIEEIQKTNGQIIDAIAQQIVDGGFTAEELENLSQLQAAMLLLAQNKRNESTGLPTISESNLSVGELASQLMKSLGEILGEGASSSSSSGAIIGENFSAGIAGGIRAGIPDIIAAATEAANAASAGTSLALDEHSPSRVGFGQGLFYVQGIANGITESVGLITDAVLEIGEIARRNLSIAPPVYGRYAQYGGGTPDTSGAVYGEAHSAARSGFGADAGAIGNAMANALIRSGALSGDVLLDGVKVGRRTAKPVEATNNRRAMQTVSVRGRSEVTI